MTDANAMTAAVDELVARARAAGVELRVEGRRLRFRAAPGALGEELKAELAASRSALIDELRREASTQVVTGDVAENQHGLWLLHRLDPLSAAYNVAFAAWLDGPVDTNLLEESLQVIVDRHESLRTSYPLSVERPVRAVSGHLPFELEVVDATDWPADELDERVEADYAKPFDLEQGPLLRASFYRAAEDRGVLLLTAHHIAVDGTSLFLLLEEATRVYSALVEGRPAPPAEDGGSFSDFVDWQRTYLAGAEKEREYWNDVLKPPPLPLELPASRARESKARTSGDTVWQPLDRSLSARLREFSRQEGVTEYMLFLGVWYAFLARLSGESDITVGTPVQGRPAARFSRTIGDFVNTLPLRVRGVRDTTLRQLLKEVQQTVRDGIGRQDYPLPRMMQETAAREAMGSAPFRTLFAYQDFSRFQEVQALMLEEGDVSVRFGALSLRPYHLDQQQGQFELALDIWPRESGMLCGWRFDDSLYDRSIIESWARSYAKLLEEAIAAPDTELDALPVVAAHDHALFEQWNATERDYPQEVTLTELISEQCARTPDAVALSFEGQVLTYAALDARANRLARYLRDQGVQRNSLVCVSVERSLDLVVALLGVLKSGGAYVPLDPEYPPERLAFMFSDTEAKVLLTQQHLVGVFDARGASVLCMDSDETVLASFSDEPLNGVATASDLAYVIYTSGSTGKPKGVMNEHRGIVNRLLWMQDEYQLSSTDNVVQKTPSSFDVSVWEFFWPLMVGAKLTIAKPKGHGEPAYLATLIREAGVTVAHFVPSMLQLFLAESNLRDYCKSLRLVVCSGEALPRDVVNRFHRELDAELHNLYGPTEAAVDVTHWHCRRDLERRTVPIGRPIANTRMYILDQELNPVPLGVSGELYIGGIQVARGYWKRPDLTRERFLPDPFHEKSGSRMYKTGDLAWYDRHGVIEYLGRVDFQIKLRGLRIELGEIETCLEEHSRISQCIVVLREPQPGDQRLVAYYVANGEVTAAEMRSHMRHTLPEYMIPQFFVPLDRVPLTPNGKVDRKALPAPQADATDAPAYSPPRTATETRLAAIWQELLGADGIGRDDNFFERGGHSLLAARASGRLNVELGVDLPLRAWFEAPTLSELATRVESLTSDRRGGRPSEPIQSISRTGDLPLSHAQRRLWFLDHLEPQSDAYVLPGAVSISGVIDPAIVERSVTEIVRRHEALRTVFRTVDGSPKVVIRQHLEHVVTLLDLRDLPRDKREEQTGLLLEDNAHRPFNLSEGPLFRIQLVQLAEAEYLFLMAFHHIVFDHWSAVLFVREFSSLYNSFLSCDVSSLPEPPLQFVDFAHWQGRRLTDQRELHLRFWKSQLDAHLPPLALAEDRPRMGDVRGASRRRRVDGKLRNTISRFSHAHNVTPAMTLLAVFQVLLHRLSSQEVIQTGLPIAGRDHPDTSGLIGYFINTVVVRSQLDSNSTFDDFLERTRDALLGAYEHQDMPFEELVAALDPVRDVNRTPLFQAFFNYIDMAVPELSIHGATIKPLMQFEASSKFDMTLYVLPQGGSLDLILNYNALIFDAGRMERFLAQYVLLAEELLEAPGENIAAASLVDHDVRAILPDPAQPVPDEISGHPETLTMPDLASHGDRPAILAPDGTWSYLQLSQRADRIAALLVNAGVQRGAVVALHGHRGPMLVCAMLGVLRAGAAFAILDPAYPAARLAACFRAAEPSGILHVGATPQPQGELERAIAATPLAIQSTLDPQALENSLPPAADAPARDLSGDDLAYIAFTSGTTGGVKAIAGTHGPVAHFLAWQRERFGLRDDDRFSMLSGLAHDPLLRDVFAPLGAGATLCIPSSDVLDDPAKLRPWMREQSITIAHITPTRVQALDSANSEVRMSSLRYAFLGGESLRADSVRQLRQLAPAATCVNFYGATETPQAMAYYVVPSEEGALRERVPLGRGIDGVQLLIVNGQGKLAGVGEPGEIVVRTQYLSRGYLRDPELSKRRFCPNPFGSREDDRVYRTGDLGRYLPDGAVEFAGRMDNQIKLRGFRIEPEEIDSVLCEMPSVSASATILYEAPHGDSRLVSYLVLNKGQSSITDIRKRLRAVLPDYMVPQQFIALDSIPLTPNGKLDRKALPPPQQHAPGRPESVEPPQSATEQLLVEIWKDIIGCESISRTDNFFDLGGHSMMVIQAIARIEAQTGWRPGPRLFILENLAEIASQCDLNRPQQATKRPLLRRFRALFDNGAAT